MKQGIYETRGRAKEFCDHALNIYKGCEHGCVYCYGPDVTHNPSFFREISGRITPGDIERSAAKWADRLAGRPVLISFISDPYQPLEAELHYTQCAIEILNRYGIPVHILTKAGGLPQRDFRLLAKFPGNAFATTLTLTDPVMEKEWEPGAAPYMDRIKNLIWANNAGIETWASLEPVIDPDQTIQLIHYVQAYVRHFKLGTLNYHPRAKEIDWKEYAHRAITLLNGLEKPYYIKKDLAEKIWDRLVQSGYWVGL